MNIGVPKEIKLGENRVAMTPGGVAELIRAGHTVFVERGAGLGSGMTDDDYEAAGAQLIAEAREVYTRADMIVKVKEPEEHESDWMRPGQILFTYLHLAAVPHVTRALLDKKVTAIGYETIQLPTGELPLLTPMSEVAGRMAIQIGSRFLEKAWGGKGVLLGGVPGVAPANVVVIGAGNVGTGAAHVALGMGANVTLIDNNVDRLRYLDDILHGKRTTLMSNYHNIEQAVKDADLLVGAVLVPGARAPQLVTEKMVKRMQPGSVIVDVAIDQGGCIETADKVSTHREPTYERHGIIHYAVANMPGAVPRTATMALTNVTLRYIRDVADYGVETAVRTNPALARGVNCYDGHVTYKAVAEAHDLEYTPLGELLGELNEVPQ